VAEFLSAEWVELLRGTGTAPGPAGTVQMVVTAGPDGDVKWHARVDDGVVVEAELGARPAPDVTLTLSYAEARALVSGELEPSVAFMRGRMKTAGDPGLVLDLLAAAATPSWRATREQLAADTDA
jgi:SCP-2 sterol transfer family